MLEVFFKGGPVMVVMLVLSIYVTAIILYKLYQFWKLKINQLGFSRDVLRCLKEKDVSAALTIVKNHTNPLAKVAETALHCTMNHAMPKQVKENEVGIAGTAALRKLESYLKSLEMSANIAPLLGLFGTVTGMVKTFASLENAGAQVDPSLLAGGIWEALVSTVAGLGIAIAAIAAYYFIDGRVEKFRHAMEEVTTRILDMETAKAA